MQTSHFVLNSPGMSVCWHPEETFKVVISNLAFFHQTEETRPCVIHAHIEEKSQWLFSTSGVLTVTNALTLENRTLEVLHNFYLTTIMCKWHLFRVYLSCSSVNYSLKLMPRLSSSSISLKEKVKSLLVSYRV